MHRIVAQIVVIAGLSDERHQPRNIARRLVVPASEESVYAAFDAIARASMRRLKRAGKL